MLGGVAGAGIAVGPILGGWVTTYLSWRVVFAGEVVVVIGILLGLRWLPADRGRAGPSSTASARCCPRPAWPRSCSACSTRAPGAGSSRATRRSSPSASRSTPFLIAAGVGVLAVFRGWQRRREAQEREPLVHLRLFERRAAARGLAMFGFQNLILMGIFFAIPLYLQVVQGLDAFETGLRMLPVSVTLFITALLRVAARRSDSRRARSSAPASCCWWWRR